VVATPIGNLGDITLRALEVLRGVDRIACEDTRVTGRLLHAHDIPTPMLAYHDHNADEVRPRLLARLAAGESMALVSDAGTPLISDPGYKLVRACHEQGIAVTALPGPSAVTTALVLAGLPTDRYLFAGFLPARTAARQCAIRELALVPATLVLFESAHRLPDLLNDLEALLGGREAAVVRELTKLFEEVRRGSLQDISAYYRREGSPKGEVVVVIGPPRAGVGVEGLDEQGLDAALRAAMAGVSLRDAAAMVAAAHGLPRRQVYARALAIVSQTGNPAETSAEAEVAPGIGGGIGAAETIDG